LLVAAAVLGSAAVVGGCGDDDDNGGDQTASANTVETTAGGSGTATEAESAGIAEFGEEATPEDAGAATDAVRGYLIAQSNRDWETACQNLSRQAQEGLRQSAPDPQLAKQGCSAILAEVFPSLGVSEQAAAAPKRITSVRVEGDQGYVLYRIEGNRPLYMPVTKEGGTWKVVALAGSSNP